MSMAWLKLFNEFASDPKFAAVAESAGCSVSVAQASFLQALVYANQQEDRGSLAGLDMRIVAAALREPLQVIERVFNAFRIFALIVGDRIVKWARRQGEAAGAISSTNPAAAASGSRTAHAIRQARYRRNHDGRQGELLLPILNVAPVEKAVDENASREASRASREASHRDVERDRDSFLLIKKRGDDLGRCAPTSADLAYISRRTQEVTATLNDRRYIADPAARDSEISLRKLNNWLNGLERWACDLVPKRTAEQAVGVIARARQAMVGAGSRREVIQRLGREDKQLLNQMDSGYRQRPVRQASGWRCAAAV